MSPLDPISPAPAHTHRMWETRHSMSDAQLIVAARGLRSFAYGMLAVVLGIALARDGLSPVAIGSLITVSLVGDFCGTYVIGLAADGWGRRRTLIGLALLMAATGAVFGLSRLYPLLLVTAFFGTLGTSAAETAPFLPIDQAMLPQTTLPAGSTRLFARYNLVAYVGGALGALAAGLPDVLSTRGLSQDAGIRLVFGLYVAVALLVALLMARLSLRVEATAQANGTKVQIDQPDVASSQSLEPARPWHRLVPPLGTSRPVVLRLAGLFSVDALAGGLVVQSLFVLYFHLRFGVALAPLAGLFFGANVLSALSLLAAAPLARRFGLLNTMVFTHLPSNILLALMTLMPTFPLAAFLLLARQALSQMDVPTRQAYSMALVPPDARTATASVTSLARSAGAATTPILAGALLQGPLLIVGLPLLLSGAIKSAYDLTLWAVFRRVQPMVKEGE